MWGPNELLSLLSLLASTYQVQHVHVDQLDNCSFADILEIQDLKDCLAIEQEEKNELSKKLQDLQKECECEVAFSFSCYSNYCTCHFLLVVLACQKLIHGNDLFGATLSAG